MNSVKALIGNTTFTYADPEKAFAAAAGLRSVAKQMQAKAEMNVRAAARIEEQAAALAARRKAMAEATAAKKREST